MRPSYGSASSQSTARSSSPCQVAPPSGPRSYGARFKYHASSSSGCCGGGKRPSRAGTPLSPASGAPLTAGAVGVGVDASGMPTGGCAPSARRRKPSFSFAFKYGWPGARSRQAAQRRVHAERSSSVVADTGRPHQEQEKGATALKAPASARLGGVDGAARASLVLVPIGVDLNVARPLRRYRLGRED